MTNMERWLRAVDFEVAEGWVPGWKTFGNSTYRYSSNAITNAGEFKCELGCEFSKITKEVFYMEAHDFPKNKAYRWIHPNYIALYRKECETRKISFKQAYDDVNFIDLETESDILSKTEAIFRGIAYDDRVEVPLELSDKEMFDLMKVAHTQDVTLNQLVTNILEGYIANFDEKDAPTEKNIKNT